MSGPEGPGPAGARDLSAFGDPASVAVVGASDDTAKWGYWLARGARSGAHRRRVYLVNSRAASVLGTECFPSLGALPEVPELVAFAVPAPALPACVEEAVALGTAGLLAVTAGIEDDSRIRTALAAGGTRLIGPNCLGIYDSSTELALAWGAFAPGNLAIVSQSGQLGLELAALAERAGIGVSRFVSVGSQLDVTAADILDGLAGHDATSLVAVYLESFGDAPRTLAAMDRLRTAGKPVLVLTVGNSEASRAAARSHTGSMTSSMDVVDAACRAVGAVRVNTPGQLVDAAGLIVRSPLPAGRRLTVVTDGGGQGAIAADTAERHGFTVAPLPADVQAGLVGRLPAHATVTNPVDLAGAGEKDIRSYGAVVTAIVESHAANAVVLSGYFGSYARDVPAAAQLEHDTARAIAAAADRCAVPVVVHSMAESGTTVDVLREHGVAVYHNIDAALGALRTARAIARPPTARATSPAPSQRPRPAGQGYFAARQLLTDAGVAFPPAVHVPPGQRIPPGLPADLAPPYVLKADWIEHKTEVGGVLTGLPDEGALTAAFDDMAGRLGPHGYTVEQMDVRTGVIELIVAARRDPVFGPVVVVGAGGVTAEVDPDTAMELAPCTPQTALAMVRRLRIRPLLEGWRGRPGVDVRAVAEVIVAVSDTLCARPDLTEIEINPVRAGADAAVAVDALIVADRPGPHTADARPGPDPAEARPGAPCAAAGTDSPPGEGREENNDTETMERAHDARITL
ncbi:acetate--CoA ligase family protein [Streptomyces fuscichromogenes]|uniref:acetate--CoA ligase family protein n=1 Tax=Streptomyces fuscichromogenes TaxID=1324013 RepID=UPI003800AE8C